MTEVTQSVRGVTRVRRPKRFAGMALLVGALVVFAAAVAGAAPLGTITTFALPSANARDTVGALRAGPDGNLWFTDSTAKAIWKSTPSGTLSEYLLSTGGGGTPTGAGAGADGNVWFGITGPAGIGKITPSGTITEYRGGTACAATVPKCVGSLYAGSVPSSNPGVGPDGNIWFADHGNTAAGIAAIGMITASGAITEYSVALNGGNLHSDPLRPVAGPDGNVWFTDAGQLTGGVAAIGEINPTTGAIHEFSSGLLTGSSPFVPAVGPDGNVWFTDKVAGGAIGKINPTTGAINEYSSGLPAGSVPQGLAEGPDGNMWFGDIRAINSAIGVINPNTQAISEYVQVFDPSSGPAVGSDGNLWFDHGLNLPPALVAQFGVGVCGGGSLQGCNLSNANLQNIVLNGGNLQGSNLQNAQLQNANLIGANLQGDNLAGAQFQNHAFLSYANLQGDNLANANLAGADLANASLQGANLQGADLAGANFTNADLTGANLQDADVTGVTWTGANLTGANLPVSGLNAPLVQITEFSSGFNPGAIAGSLTPGADGNLWFTDRGTGSMGRISPAGGISEYPLGLPAGSVPGSGSGGGLSYGPDGNLWFTDSGTKAIGVFNPFSHAVSEFSAGLNPGSQLNSLVAGGDGNVWFTDQGTTKAIGVINPTTHAISEFSSGLNAGSLPGIPTFGPDGNIWFADGGTTRAIGRINVSTHAIAEFSSGISSTGASRAIAGPDGNLWFVDKSRTAPAVGRITPNGVITEFPVTLLPGQFLNAANFGPDGGLWIGADSPGGIARFDLTTHAYTTFSNSLSGQPGVLVAGPDLNMWSTDSGATPAFARVGTGVCPGSSQGCNLSGLNVPNVVLVGAQLQGDNLDGADLENARLIGASLQGDNLNNVDLTGAQLQLANLGGDNLANANLAGANLTGASLAGSNLQGVTWSNTTCPDGTNSNNDGGTCANDE
jgi:streptogramin lyase